jgi:hypothetical protein
MDFTANAAGVSGWVRQAGCGRTQSDRLTTRVGLSAVAFRRSDSRHWDSVRRAPLREEVRRALDVSRRHLEEWRHWIESSMICGATVVYP